MKRLKNKKILSVIVALLFVLLAAGYTVFIKPKEDEEQIVYKEEIVQNGDLVQGIMESGSVELETVNQKYDVIITEDDEEDDEDDEDDEDEDEEDTKYLKIEDVYVKQGQRIKEGDAVLKLTEKSMRSVRRYLEAEQAEAEIALEELQNEYEVEQVEANNTYLKSLKDLEWSDIQYAIDTTEINVEAAALANSVAVLEQEIKQLELDLEDSWEDYADLKEEYEKYERRYHEWDEDNLYLYIPLREEYLSLKERYETETESRLDKRQEMADKQDEILEIQEDIVRLLGQTERKQMQAKQIYDSSVMSGNMAQEVYQYSLQSLEKSIATAKAELEDFSERLADFDAFVGEDGTVYAQGDGLITRVYYEEGDTLKQESTLITYVQEDSYVLSIDISEEDIPYVEVGDAVTIVFTAYPEETYNGRIEEIVSTKNSESTATVSYPVTVRVEGDTSKLYGGMTGDVTFVTDQVEKVNYVSRKAIQKEDGKSYVLIKDEAGEMVRKEVETGFTDGVSIQIVNGLSEGDVIYIESRVRAAEKEDKTAEKDIKQGGRDEKVDKTK